MVVTCSQATEVKIPAFLILPGLLRHWNHQGHWDFRQWHEQTGLGLKTPRPLGYQGPLGPTSNCAIHLKVLKTQDM